MLKTDMTYLKGFVSQEELKAEEPYIREAHETLARGTGEGGEFRGWLTLPEDYDREEVMRIKDAAAKIRSESDVLLVIGIGGSYLGARAALEALLSPNYNLLTDGPQIFFVGNSLSPDSLREVAELIGKKDFSINVISKSGTTTEPAIAFRYFRELLVKRYGESEADWRVYATTDRQRGALKSMADERGWETFVVPDDIGGRYSVLTAVGLLPLCAAGVNIDALLKGARSAMESYGQRSMDNPAWQYAGVRNLLYKKGKDIEIFASYEPRYAYLAEWWKQLFGESEGKDGKGLYPASVLLTADLHSMGQYIQDGQRKLFETVLDVKDTGCDIELREEAEDGDGLNYLKGKKLSFVREMAERGTTLAHLKGGAPTFLISLDRLGEEELGELFYFFMLSCGISGYMLGVNPFNQPGVEEYKRNMFALLGKPGYENLRKELNLY